MTLVEIMCTILISVIISGVLIYTIAFEVKSWKSIVPNSNVRSNSLYVMKKFQGVFQNLSNPALDKNYPDGTAIMATDPTGAKVEIRLQEPGVDSVLMNQKTPIIGIEISVTPAVDSNNQPITPDVSNGLLVFNDTSFTGTTFTVDRSIVDVHLDATYYGGSSSNQYQVEQEFATGGGD